MITPETASAQADVEAAAKAQADAEAAAKAQADAEAAASPTTLSEAMNAIAAERDRLGKPRLGGAALQAIAEERHPGLVGNP